MVLDITASTFSTTLASGYTLGTSNSTGLSGFINTLMTTNCGFAYTAGSFSTSNILVYAWTASGASKGSFYIEIAIAVSGTTFTITPRLLLQSNYNTGTFTATASTAASANSFTVSSLQTLVGYSLPIATTDVKGFVLHQGSFNYCGACLVCYPSSSKPSYLNETNYCVAGIFNNITIGRFSLPYPNLSGTTGGSNQAYFSYNPDASTFYAPNTVDGTVDVISSPLLFYNQTSGNNNFIYGKLPSDIAFGNANTYLIGDTITKTAGSEVYIIIVPATTASPALLLRTT
jgi:hypothetical protein